VAYRLRPDRSVALEVRRIADAELAGALDQLHALGSARRDRHVREARRHVRNIRALLRLVRPALGETYTGASRRLRAVNRMLAPVVEARAAIETFDHIAPVHGDWQTGPAMAAIREGLLKRATLVDRKAELERVLAKTSRLLRLERTRIDGWTFSAGGIRAVAPGLGRSARRARRAAAEARERPTAAHYHAWHRGVEELRLHVQLLNARCGRALAAQLRSLEALESCLREYDRVVLLEHILMTEAIVTRGDTIRGLRLLREWQVGLRRRAEKLTRRALADTPRQFTDRVRRAWRTHDAQVPGRRGVARRAA
jgi:hypothetical protein